ncbi:MAG: pseudaminic acid cytidylyltransferase [Lentisphaerae bacterium GWF2_52_8]|nr:MAG: pseudaminic acid cytidylyltransferase [Lentisphaerae bacterium GWF2_52_8]
MGKTVAIIPARGGSKRIPDKNVRDFAGNPMLSYPISAAKDAGIFDRIIVSTDSERIASIAKDCGAELPFIRPPELANDFAGTEDVMFHALDWLKAAGYDVEYFCCIYATAPFLKPEFLREGFQLLKEKNATSVFSVGTIPCPIFRALKIEPDGRMAMFWPEYRDALSNTMPKAYQDAGQFYFCREDRFREEKQLISTNSFPVILPRHLVHDIDHPEDWETAEKIFCALNGKAQ